ncbi:2,3,4,5-tetrahydropyridine-2,6-dicarboxylate N-succinyltransferase [bacterium]|nr:2,3,4,5-tetrahydropyridine-2,6-dicarboxylate N-succinyltransferase [bacterium]
MKAVSDHASLATEIAAGWAARVDLNSETRGPIRQAVDAAIDALDTGAARVAEPDGAGGWRVNEWLKQAVLLSFRLNANTLIPGGPGPGSWWDKVPSKFDGWGPADFETTGFRAVPGAVVRRGAYVAPDAVLMPSFINIGARVGDGTMIDTWSTVGSCAQIGARVHISGGVGVGGVLEPLQATPVIIEDGCFIGARSEVAEGVIVREGAVLGMGVFLGASTPIMNRATGETLYGEVPPYSVVVSGVRPGKAMPDGSDSPSLYCAVIVKQVDARTRSKTSVNDLLRT